MRRFALTVLGVGLVSAGLAGVSGVSADDAPIRLAQFGRPGGGFNQGGGSNQGGGFNQGGRGGSQGGILPGGGTFTLAAGKSAPLLAFCTDLFAEPPTGDARFRIAAADALVTLPGGSELSLTEAIQRGVLAVRGHSNSFDPVGRAGSLALDLHLGNFSQTPVQVSFRRGAQLTPQGQSDQSVPPEIDKVLELASKKALTYKNTVQYAVWASQGRTLEDVEQSYFARLSSDEVGKVQGLLDGAGLEKKFDRERGAYEKRFESMKKELGDSAKQVSGTALRAGGARLSVDVFHGEKNEGVARVKTAAGDTFYCRAAVEYRPTGGARISLRHLVTGRRLPTMPVPLSLPAAAVAVQPAASAPSA